MRWRAPIERFCSARRRAKPAVANQGFEHKPLVGWEGIGIVHRMDFRLLVHRIRLVEERLGMVSLRANQTRQGTSRIAIRLQAPDDVDEVISGTPPELLASQVVDIYPPNTGEHFPVPPLIFRFVFRDPL